MTKTVKEFVRERLHLIDTDQWEKFYDEVVNNDDFQLLYMIGELTEFLYSCGCDPLAHMTTIPVGYLAGSNRSEFIIPEHIKCIEMGAFRGVKNLKKITIPKNCNQISTNAFFYCSSLEEVNIQCTNQFFGDEVFSACSKLYDINYAGTKAEWLENPIHDVEFVINCSDGRLVVDAEGKVHLDE
jgi:hypothetical protein